MMEHLSALFFMEGSAELEAASLELGRGGFDVEPTLVRTASELRGALQAAQYDVVICSDGSPELDHAALLAIRNAYAPRLPLIVVSGAKAPVSGALHAGPADVIERCDLTHLGSSVRRQLAAVAAQRIRLSDPRVALFTQVLDRANQGVMITDSDLAEGPHILYVNDALVAMTGHVREDIIGRTPRIFQGPATSRETRRRIADAMHERRPIETDIVNYRADGTELCVNLSIFPLRDEEGNVTKFGAIQRDVTERNAMQDALHQRQARIDMVVHQLPAAIWTVDAELRFTSLSGAGFDALDVRSAELLGKPLSRIPEMSESLHRRALKGIAGNGDITIAGRTLQVALTPLRDLAGEAVGAIGVGLDVSEQRAAEARIEYLRDHDNDTGLENYQRFIVRVAELLAEPRPRAAIFLIDFDRYDDIVAALGMAAGDALLRSVAHRLLQLDIDDRAARTSNGLAIIGRRISSRAKAEQFARRIQKLLESSIEIAGRTMLVTACTGIVLVDGLELSPEALVGSARAGIRQIRERGGKRWSISSSDRRTEIAAQIALESDLRLALLNDELIVHYQPIVGPSGELRAAEALVRWNHPRLGFIPPDRFIPLAESTGIIADLTEVVVAQAAAQHRRWRAAGYDVRLALNWWAHAFENVDVASSVEKLLTRCGMPANLVDIEITESGVLRDPEAAIASFAQLRAMGIRISIDDFGTGHSSLAYLKRFRIDSLKIDRYFVNDIGTSTDEPVAWAILQLARILGLNAIAEGVETAEQFRLLRGHGCDEFQGYFFSRPLAPDAFLEYARDNATTFLRRAMHG